MIGHITMYTATNYSLSLLSFSFLFVSFLSFFLLFCDCDDNCVMVMMIMVMVMNRTGDIDAIDSIQNGSTLSTQPTCTRIQSHP